MNIRRMGTFAENWQDQSDLMPKAQIWTDQIYPNQHRPKKEEVDLEGIEAKR